jgi:ribosomal protein S19
MKTMKEVLEMVREIWIVTKRWYTADATPQMFRSLVIRAFTSKSAAIEFVENWAADNDASKEPVDTYKRTMVLVTPQEGSTIIVYETLSYSSVLLEEEG